LRGHTNTIAFDRLYLARKHIAGNFNIKNL
jgi:hypothetical protein